MENLFEYYIETENFHFKYAKGEPAVKEQEFHDYDEFVFFIKGESLLISKNIQQKLAHGSVVLIPKEHFHQFCVKNPQNYVRCILGFREIPEICNLARQCMNTIKVISAPDIRITSVFEQLIEIVKSELADDEKAMFIYASLIKLLIQLKRSVPEMIVKSNTLSDLVTDAINIIDEQYTQNLSVEIIAQMLNVSSSTLSHKFKKELNISLYRYIIKKRLSVAREYIRRGELMKNAALNSGFSDYSCFYRLYKRYYGAANE